MKTETPVAPAASPAGNLTVQQLARTLTQTASPPAKEDETVTAAETEVPETPREETPATDGAATEAEATDLSQTKTETTEPAAEAGEPEAETEVETQPVKGELPDELRDAIELAKGEGKKGVADLLKRVHKLVDERDTNRNARLQAEERTRQLTEQLEQLQAQPQEARPGSEPGGTHPEVARINQALSEVNGFLKLFRENPDGVEIDDGEGGKTALSAEDIAEHLERLTTRKTELVTERAIAQNRVKEQFRTIHSHVHGEAVKAYPWLNDAKSPEYQRMERMLKATPWLKQFPDYELVLGDYFRGEAARKTAAKPKPAAAREPARVPTDAPSAAASPANATSAAKKEVQRLQTAFEKSGKAEDLRKLEAAKRKLSRAG